MSRELTGRHVLIIATVSFGIVIAANLAMLFAATGSFPGLVVKNAYVAGVGWNARAEAQQALGWTADVAYRGGAIEVRLTDPAGRAVEQADLRAVVGRPAGRRIEADQVPVAADGVYRFVLPLEAGQWRVDLATVSGPAFQITARLMIPEAP